MGTKINSIEEFKQAEKAMLEQLVEQLKQEGFFELAEDSANLYYPPGKLIPSKAAIEKMQRSILADTNVSSFRSFSPQSFQPTSFSDNLVKNKPKSKKAAKAACTYAPVPGNTYKWEPDKRNDMQVVHAARIFPKGNPSVSTYVAPGVQPSIIKPGEYLSDFQLAELAFPADNENFSIEGGIEYKNVPLYSKDIRPSITDAGKQDNVTMITVSHKDSGGGLIAGSAYLSDTEKSVLIVNPLDNTLQSAWVYEHREYLQGGPVIIETREVYIDFGNWKKKMIYQKREGVSVSLFGSIAKKARIKGFKPSIDFKATTNWEDVPINPADQVSPPPDVIMRGH